MRIMQFAESIANCTTISKKLKKQILVLHNGDIIIKKSERKRQHGTF